MRVKILLVALAAVGSFSGSVTARMRATPGMFPFETMTFEEVASVRAAGTGCTWLGGSGLTRRMSMKEDRGAVKRNGRIIALRPVAGAKEVFPYTFHHWSGGGMDVLIENSEKEITRGPEHVVTVATLTVTENGRTRSWPGRLSCGS